MQIPSNVVVDESEQGSDSWLRARCGIFTASRAGDLMKKQKNGKPYATRGNYITEIALERLTHELPESFTSTDMQEGIDRERTAALAYSFHTGNETEQTGLWIKGFYGASPDDLIVGQNGGVEYKNPRANTHKETLESGNIPEHYYWQLLQNMLVTGADFWDYVSFHPAFPPNAQLFIKRIERENVQTDLDWLEQELIQANLEADQIVNFIENYKGV